MAARRPARVALLVDVAGAACAVAIGLTVPATTRRLIERERIGMLNQVHALVTGFGEPTPTRLVTTYTMLILTTVALAWRNTRYPGDGLGDAALKQGRESVPVPATTPERVRMASPSRPTPPGHEPARDPTSSTNATPGRPPQDSRFTAAGSARSG